MKYLGLRMNEYIHSFEKISSSATANTSPGSSFLLLFFIFLGVSRRSQYLIVLILRLINFSVDWFDWLMGLSVMSRVKV